MHPALSYFDHPPMVAWVIGAGYFLLGKSELGVRIGGFLLTLLSTWLLYALGKLWFNKKAGLWAALLFQLLPLFFVYGVLITPDVPLTFFWLLTLYLFSLALREDQKWAWYVAGAALGLSMLSKYTGVFLVPSAFLFLILDSRYRPWLLRKEPYLGLVIALIVFAPVILWNIEHGWTSFVFQVATAALLCLRLVTAFLIEITPQEAYYWNYAMHPALSYFDHPPMVAWVIRAGYFLLGKSELGVRIGGFLLTLLSTWFLYALGKVWFSKRAGLWAALLFQLLPLFFVYGVLITPDVPLTFFWLLTLYLFSLALGEDKKWAWYLAGGALGLSMLSKYTGIFLVPSAFLFLILHPRYRPWLLRREPYLALVVALIVFAPVILWNIEHGWTSFVFQVSNRLSEETSHPLGRLVEFLFVQLGVTSPMLLVGLLLSSAIPVSLSMKDRRTKWRFCFLFSAPLLLFFLFYTSSFFGQGQLDAPRVSLAPYRRLSCLPLSSVQQRTPDEARCPICLVSLVLRFADHLYRCHLPLDCNDPQGCRAPLDDRLERVRQDRGKGSDSS